jgi:hypothetical protein
MSVYIRPQIRKKQEEEHPDVTNVTSFPTLGNPGERVWDKGKKSFKATIDSLIAFEKLSEQEKAARAEEQRVMEGWHVLKLPMTCERLIAFNENIYKDVADENDYYCAPIIVEEAEENESVVSEDTFDEANIPTEEEKEAE